MTAQEKAIELVQRFETYADYHECDAFSERQWMRFNAVSIALIAIDEMIEECLNWTGGSMHSGWDTNRFDYLEEVKKQIQKL